MTDLVMEARHVFKKYESKKAKKPKETESNSECLHRY